MNKSERVNQAILKLCELLVGNWCDQKRPDKIEVDGQYMQTLDFLLSEMLLSDLGYAEAVNRAVQLHKSGKGLAKDFYYEKSKQKYVMKFALGGEMAVEAKTLFELMGYEEVFKYAAEDDLAAVNLICQGSVIRWESFDIDVSVTYIINLFAD